MNYHSLFFLLLAAALPAQQSDPAFLPWLGSPGEPGGRGDLGPEVRPLVPTVLLNRTAGLQLLDGELWGGADSYKVRFDADGFEFTKALGPAAPRNYPLTFAMESCGRGAELLQAPAGKRSHHGLRVEYDRGTVSERYDLGTEAMEQSFVFHSRPQGRGDLIVRGRLHTDMVVTAENGGLRFEQPGFGGFYLGAVTGIDKNGMRATGAVRCEHGVLELSLPAEFVDRAAFPLVLDPLIGIAFGLNLITGFDDREPLAAFDASNDCYLVIWSNIFSATDTDVNGQRIARTGSLLGTRVFIETSTAREIEPTIANVNGRNTFVVAYNRNGDILARGVLATNGAVGLLNTVASGSSNQHSPSIGGDAVNAVVGNTVCVWESDAEPAVLATKVSINVDGTLSTSATVHTLASGTVGRPSRPRVSKGGGGIVRFLVVFERLFANREPWAIVVSVSGMPLTAAVPVDSAGAKPEVDGNGTNWVVAWQRGDDVFSRSLSIAGSPAALSAAPIVRVDFGQAPVTNETNPSVIWTGLSTLVGCDYLFLPVFGDSAAVTSLDPFHCAPCEGVSFPHALGAGAESTPFGCSALSGSGPVDDVLLVWYFITTASPTNADIAAQFWRSADGTVTSLGGSCGTGGVALASCARVGNANFTHRLRGNFPLAVTVLVQSLSQAASTCNLCTLVPSPSSSVWSLFVSDAVGNVVFPSAIPNNPALSGFELIEQWLTLRPGGACTAFDIDMSNALRIVIE